MRHNWFRRMLLAYTPVFLVALSFLMVIFYQTLGDQIRREAVRTNESLAGQAFRHVEQLLKTLDRQVLRESMVNESFQRFLNASGDNQVYANVEAVKAMQDLTINFPIIDSVYIVRYSDSLLLSLSMSSTMDSYGDAAFIRDYVDGERSPEWSDQRSYQEFSTHRARQVVTIARQMPFYTGSKGFIIVNVNVERLMAGVREMYDPGVSFVDVIDRSGAALLSGRSADMEPSGEVISTFNSSYTGWTVESGFLGNVRMHQSIIGLWVPLGLLVIFLALLWTIYVTRREYKPLEQLVGQIRRYSDAQSQEMVATTHHNEFKLIGHALEQLQAQSNQLDRERAEDIEVLKKYEFENLLQGTGAFPDWEAMRKRLGLSETYRPSTVFIMEIDRYATLSAKLGASERNVIRAALEGVVVDEFAAVEGELWCGWTGEHQLSGVLTSAGPGEQKHPMADGAAGDYEDTPHNQETYIFLERCRRHIAEYSSVTVTFGMSEHAMVPEDLRRAYRESEEALEYKASTGRNKVIVSNIVRKHDEGELYHQLKTIRQIVFALRLPEPQWRDHYRLLFDQIRRARLRKDELMNLTNFLIYHLDRETELLPQEIRLMWQQTTMTGMHDILQSFDTMEEIEERFFQLLSDLSERISTLRETRNYHELMVNVRTYIEQHYANSELSLDHLSERFDINSKYLSKLFKETFGEKFVDFLIERRMEAAKQLLADHDDSIADISEQVGYTSSNSFTRVFRKVCGVSPGEYRKNIRRQLDGEK